MADAHSVHLKELSRQYVQQLETAARAYFTQGLDSFDWSADADHSGHAQAAIGNLTVAIELLAKAFIAQQELSLVLTAPSSAFVAFCRCPASLPEDFATKAHVRKALYDEGKTRQFDDCIALVYLFLPHVRQELDFALRHFRRRRNVALHSALADFDRFETLQVAWSAVKFFDAIGRASGLGGSTDPQYLPPTAAVAVKEFEGERMKRLSEVVEKARTRAEKLSGPIPEPVADDPRTKLVFECPVCHNSALLVGDVESDFDEEWDEDFSIRTIPVAGVFHAQSLDCAACGLKLKGQVELAELGVETRFDVTESLAEWWAKHPELANQEEEELLADWDVGYE